MSSKVTLFGSSAINAIFLPSSFYIESSLLKKEGGGNYFYSFFHNKRFSIFTFEWIIYFFYKIIKLLTFLENNSK